MLFSSVLRKVVPTGSLTLESEGNADLVGSFVEFLGVEGSTKTESDTSAELDVVSKSSKTLVVDLGLYHELVKPNGSDDRKTNLCERGRIKLVLGGNLETDV